MATEEVRTMWVIFLGSGMAFGIAALVLVWIGSRVILSIRRQQKKFEIEDETYNKVKEAIKEKENKNEKAAAEAENTKTKAKAQAEANKELSASITDELIKMKEAEAHYKNGWVTVQGADAVIADK
jgi:uncharacterized membrane protein YhiD involved in acid resistance